MKRRAKKPVTRHVVSINDLTNKEIEEIFALASDYLKKLADESIRYRIARGTNVGSRRILASLFYEPSTRTRLSFESAMLRLGGENITSADPKTSSAAKGESLADSVRVISNYADIVVIRHPRDGAARLAAEYSSIPVINGGDGSHEHPTQTLCDLFTLTTKNRTLKNLKVAIAGDLKRSRTIHSFVYALARFGAHIVPIAAPGLELPPHVDQRLREEFNCIFDVSDASVGALYRTPEGSHQPALFARPEYEISVKTYKEADTEAEDKHIAAVYVTRFQKERSGDQGDAYPRIDSAFLSEPRFSHASVLHPLPRVDELDSSIDADTRAMYFAQAAYGVPIRMALISVLLGLDKGSALHRFESGFEPERMPEYDQPRDEGIACSNMNCIVHDSSERQYTSNKFYLVKLLGPLRYKLRCAYCETDIDRFVIASKKGGWFTPEVTSFFYSTNKNFTDLIAFPNEADAMSRGFRLDDVADHAGHAHRRGARMRS